MITEYLCNYRFYHKFGLIIYLLTELTGVNSTSCL